MIGDVALGQDLALVDEDDPRGQGLDLGQDVARDEDGPALLLEVLDEPDELALAQRVEPAQRLVEDEDLRVVGDGLGELDPLAHAPAVAADEAVLVLREVDDVQGPGRPVPDLGLREAVEPEQAGEELPAGHVLVEDVLLGAEPDRPEELRDRSRPAGRGRSRCRWPASSGR